MSNQKTPTQRPGNQAKGGPARRRPIAGERMPRVPASAQRPVGETAPPAPPPAPPVERRVDLPVEQPAEEPAEATTTAVTGPGRGVPVWLLAVLGAVAAALVAGTAWYGIPMWRAVQEEQAVAQTRRTAPAAAERAAVPILSYDYRSLRTDRASAARFMTPQYRQKYVKTFDSLVDGNAQKLHAKVDAKVLASGVSAADADRARVLLYVNQTTTSTANGGDPQVALNRVMMDMVRRDGTWLVNGISSY
jgi:Mce-associated membrane protein